jgi:predicted transposase YbfD/YdcC
MGRRFNDVARSDWGIENTLHWRLDVVMNEDQDKIRFGNGPHTWPFCATWLSMRCRKKARKAPCGTRANELDGKKPISPAGWL